jgi:hypothetical protein
MRRAAQGELHTLYSFARRRQELLCFLVDILRLMSHAEYAYLVRCQPARRSIGPLRLPAAAPVRLSTTSNGVIGACARSASPRMIRVYPAVRQLSRIQQDALCILRRLTILVAIVGEAEQIVAGRTRRRVKHLAPGWANRAHRWDLFLVTASLGARRCKRIVASGCLGDCGCLGVPPRCPRRRTPRITVAH